MLIDEKAQISAEMILIMGTLVVYVMSEKCLNSYKY